MADGFADILVVGGGAVGLAIARRASLSGREVILVEANERFGMETSSRNSEVIHAGLYYPQASLKGRLCVRGAEMLYDFCASRGIDAYNCGKLIVATEVEQVSALEALRVQGEKNGVPGLEVLSGGRLAEKEPHLRAVAGLYSPLSGVIDSHGYMAQLAAEAENSGAIIAYRSRFKSAQKAGSGYDAVIEGVVAAGGGEEMVLGCRVLINAAGHGAHAASRRIDAVADSSIPPHYLAKGQYFTVSRKPPFSHLIYPLPSGGGLGIHLTIDSQGGGRLGPDIAWVDAMDYSVDASAAERFHTLASSYWPDLKLEDLVPSWAGVRPKIYGDGSVFQDFTVHGADVHGAENVVALYGIDSPGLTSSMALAEYVLERAGL